ncbi:MAG: hypothetical protein ACR2LY_06605 [Thermoleophilaceae bacterium]
MTSRLLITMLIAFGIVMSGTGATLAMAPNAVNTGSTTSAAQYGSDDDDDGNGSPKGNNNNNNNNNPPDGGVEPAGPVSNSPQDPPIGVLPEGPKSGVAPTTETAEAPRVGAEAPRVQAAADRGSTPRLQPIRQQADQGESLPFTGLAAIPILVVGIGLLASGLVLRRRA